MSSTEIPDSAMVAEFSQYQGLAQVVFEMRKAQREYSKTAIKSYLVAAKRLESACDVRLASLGYR